MNQHKCFHCPEPAIIAPRGKTPIYCRSCAEQHGGISGRRAAAIYDIQQSEEGFTPAALKKLAEGGIMDPNALFLPAGKLSLAETIARERVAMEAVQSPLGRPPINKRGL